MAEPQRIEELGHRPLGDLIGDLSKETSTLVRHEIELARTELSAKGQVVAAGAGMFGAAGVLAFLALSALTAAMVLALALVLPAWAAALIVAAVYAVTAGVLVLVGRDRVKEAGNPIPQTIETVREDIEWARNRKRFAEK